MRVLTELVVPLSISALMLLLLWGVGVFDGYAVAEEAQSDMFFTSSGPAVHWEVQGRQCNKCSMLYSMQPFKEACPECGEKTVKVAYLSRYIKD